jgi:hypothetical protein
MLGTLKRFAVAIIIATLVTVGFITQLEYFTSLAEVAFGSLIIGGADLLLIILFIKDYLRSR